MPSTALNLVTFEPLKLVEAWLSEYAYTGSPRTHRNYRDIACRIFVPFLERAGVHDVGAISADHLRAYLGEQAAWSYVRGGESHALSAWEIQKRWQVPFRFLGWCEENGYIDAHPMARLRRPKLPDAGRFAFTMGTRDSEVGRLRTVLAAKPGWIGARDRAIFAVALGTGARASELCAIELPDIDWKARRVLLHGKGAKDRRQPIGRNTFTALRDYLRVRPRVATNALWVNQRRVPFTYPAFAALMTHLGGYAGVADCHAHRLRHTYATAHYRQHKDLIALKNALGHTKVEVTLKYLRSLGVDMDDRYYNPPDEWLL